MERTWNFEGILKIIQISPPHGFSLLKVQQERKVLSWAGDTEMGKTRAEGDQPQDCSNLCQNFHMNQGKEEFWCSKGKKKVFFKEILWLWKFQAITKTKTPAACGQLEVFLVEEPSGGSALKFSQFASASSIFSPIWEGFPRMQKHGCCWRWAARAVSEPVSKSK